MASVKLEHIYKVYPGGVKAVNDETLDIKDGEFIVIVGPSGCGKSTTLRMIAGLEEITAGELYIGGKIMNDVEPKDRDIAMVFQNYALYPHMTVYENMAFGLKLRHVPNDVIQSKVMWAANILGLTNMLDRKPRAMSGGQRQRVALGRAILRDPKVMLLDEPLSNLDAKLRASMRTEIANLHQKLKTTFIYVTHDQTEAMTLGDRIVVMKLGRVQQFDTPKTLYEHPVNKFVAGFIGTPQMNFFDGTLTRHGDFVTVALEKSQKALEIPFNDLIKVNPSYLDGKHKVTLGIRCEHVKVSSADEANVLPVKVSHVEELGSEALIYGDINLNNTEFQDKSSQIIVKVQTKPETLKSGDILYVSFDMDHTYFFDAKTEESIVPLIPTENVFAADVNGNTLSFLGQTVALPSALTCPDGKDLTLLVPNDAFIIGQSGLSAQVVANETIQDVHLAHLKADGRVFFVKTAAPLPVGKTVTLGIDFTKIAISDKDGKRLVSPLATFDDYHASFFNYKTVIASDNDPKFVAARNERIKAAQANGDAIIDKAVADYRLARKAFEKPAYADALARLDSKISQAVLGAKGGNGRPEAQLAEFGRAFDDEVASYLNAPSDQTNRLNQLKASVGPQLEAIQADCQGKINNLKAEYRGKVKGIKAHAAKLAADADGAKVKELEQSLTKVSNPMEQAKVNLAIKLIQMDVKAHVAKAENDAVNSLYQDFVAKRSEYLRQRDDALILKGKELYDLRNAVEPIAFAEENAKVRNNDLIELTKETRDEQLKLLKANHKTQVLCLKAKNKHIYFEQKANEDLEYKEFLRINKDKDSIRRRKAEHKMFKEAYPDQKANALDEALQGEAMVYENAVSKAKAEAKRVIASLEKKIADAKEEADRRRHPIGYLTIDLGKTLQSALAQKKADVARAGLVFFFGVGPFRFLSTPAISNKLIQGLGTSVFTKEYLIEVPHDAYRLEASQKGIALTVLAKKDFGYHHYYECQYVTEYGEKTVVYLALADDIAVNSKIKVSFDISRCQITETGMGIRLY